LSSALLLTGLLSLSPSVLSCLPLASNENVTQQACYFDLPPQPLQNGLIEFALQAGVTIITDNKLLKGYDSSALAGSYSIDKALKRLLSKSQLIAEYHPSSGVYVLHKNKVVTAPVDVKSVTPRSDFEQPQREEVIVTSIRYPFRYQTVSNTHLDGAATSFNSSRFLNIIPNELIEDQQPAELGDVLKYASGITPGDGIADSNDDIFIRGFQRHALYIDGFRLSESTGIKQLPNNIERVELIKGPATLLYGQAEPGGVANAVRKKPLPTSFTEMEMALGSDGRRKVGIDINNQVPVKSDIDFRVILADDAIAEQADVLDVHRQLLATSANLFLNPETEINIGYELQSAAQTWNRDFEVIMPVGNLFAGASLSQVAMQARPEFETKYSLFNVSLTHYFSPNWHLTGKYFWHDEHRLGVRTSRDSLLTKDIFLKREELGDDFLVLVLGGQVAVPIVINDTSPETLFSIGKIRTLYDQEAFESENNISFKLEGALDIGNLDHDFTVGGDWHQQDIFKTYIVEVRDLFPNRVWPDAIFNESQTQLDIANALISSSTTIGDLEAQSLRSLYDDYGIYIQDSVELNGQWTAFVGSRYTRTQGEYTNVTDHTVTPLNTYDNFSAQLGLVYKLTDDQSIYTNYSEAMRANYHLDEIGPIATNPELSNQLELGIKSLFFDGRLMSSFGVFTIAKNNIVDLKIIEGYRTALLGHSQQVQGFDLDFTCQATSNINLMGALSWINPQITSGENQGNQPAMAAEQTASLFLHYQMRNDLSLMGGYKYVSKRFADDENRFWLGEYATVDIGVDYSLDILGFPSQLKLSVNNVFNQQYYTAIINEIRKNESAGLSAVASFALEL
jgi:iron complex outermembrane recepter protein